MKILIFDTETTGFPSPTQRIVQFASSMCKFTPRGESYYISHFMTLVKSDVAPHEKAEEVHGISKSMADNGIDEKKLALYFKRQVENADYLAAHNIKFDLQFMNMLFARLDIEPPEYPPMICTMDQTTHLCKILNTKGAGYKWPKLVEACKILLDFDIEGAHDALVDTQACAMLVDYLVKHKYVILAPRSV